LKRDTVIPNHIVLYHLQTTCLSFIYFLIVLENKCIYDSRVIMYLW